MVIIFSLWSLSFVIPNVEDSLGMKQSETGIPNI